MIAFPNTLTSSLDIDPCTYRWFVQRVGNFRQPRSYERNLDFGGAFADAMYTGRRAFYASKLSQEEAESLSFAVVDKVFAPVFFKAQEDRKQQGKSEEKIKTPDRLINLLELYWAKFPLSKELLTPFILEDSFSAEKALYVPLEFPDLNFVVNVAIKPDLIALDQQGTILLDEKTVTESDSEERSHLYLYMMREQFLLYAYSLRTLISSGGINLPPLHAFEVRRALLSREISSTKDKCTRVSWPLEPKLERDFFIGFKATIRSRLEKYLAWAQSADSFQKLLEEVAPERAYHQCFAYGRACPLLEHCAAGRDLDTLGFKPSKIDPVTKEITFD